ncbi:MAG: DUF305 domain-containing protein [Chloroflexota bacterium]|nr:DUF305 domain-containing protein [Chloroflexota bacterium]
MDRIKQVGLLLAGAVLLSGSLFSATFVLPVAAQTGPGSTGGAPATQRPGMMGGTGGMMGGTESMMGGTESMMGGAGSMMRNVDRHFIEQMIPHHQAAVAMADLALQHAQHPQLKVLAAAIKRTQTAEIAQMRAWYRQWYGTDVPTPANGTGGGMMGSAQGISGDLPALQNAADFDQAFLQGMIPHHEMALMMAQMVRMHGRQPQLQQLAQAITTGQRAEIAQMRGWYQQWYGVATP